jgi:hypothetical protein
VRVKTMMTRNPALHRAPLGLRQRRAAHVGCRMSRSMGITESGETRHGRVDDRTRVRRAPGRRRAADASRPQWISHPMMELLVARGADVNAAWHGTFPHHLCPLRVLDPDALKWLLDHGANPNCRDPGDASQAIPIQARLSITSSPPTRAPTTTERLHRHPSRGWRRDTVRLSSGARSSTRAAR